MEILQPLWEPCSRVWCSSQWKIFFLCLHGICCFSICARCSSRLSQWSQGYGTADEDQGGEVVEYLSHFHVLCYKGHVFSLKVKLVKQKYFNMRSHHSTTMGDCTEMLLSVWSLLSHLSLTDKCLSVFDTTIIWHKYTLSKISSIAIQPVKIIQNVISCSGSARMCVVVLHIFSS